MAMETILQSLYVCPKTRTSLRPHQEGLLRGSDGAIYPFLRGNTSRPIPSFLAAHEHGEAARKSLTMYDQKASVDSYRNFLDWLFRTFREDEAAFRRRLAGKLRLKPGAKVLITGCGLGDDIPPVAEAVGPDGAVYASDLAGEMVVAGAQHVAHYLADSSNVSFSVCDAKRLPFPDNVFDGAFHFGGINLFDDMRASISEMERVVKPGGRVVFGDEGIAPWLKHAEYGKIAITNNPLWASAAPLDLLPRNAVDVQMSWVLGNCFYVIDFEVSATGPFMDLDVPHRGRRGGCMRTRYFGQLEGVSQESKKFVLEDAARKGLSVHDWLEQVLREKKNSSS